MRSPRLTIGRIGFLAFLVLALAPGGSVSAAPPLAPRAAFEKLKALAGTWQGGGDTPDNPPATDVFEVTANGSAVMERLFPGTPHEMLTVYTMDGNDLVLTHYCAGANQPRMKLVEAVADPVSLKFDFVSGANLDPARDSYMHGVTFLLVAPDHIQTEWSIYAGGKPNGAHTFSLTKK